MSACAVVGGQFGSEGKGLIVGHLARDYDLHVRVGAANAGHTVWTPKPDQPRDGDIMEKHVLQQIPVAAYANPDADLFIGPGAQISPEIFVAELRRLWRWRGGSLPRLYVDPRAHIITPEQIEAEQQTDLAERIGSTSTLAREGIGTAAADRVLRTDGCVTAKSERGIELIRNVAVEAGLLPFEQFPGGLEFYYEDVPMFLGRRSRDPGYKGILLEGTQGTGLSNTTGFFPYCTSRNTTAAGLCADVGFPPNKLDRVILVCRTYPIRVAGNSGPFYKDSEEIAWSDIGVDEGNERTTVTKKVRRVATFSLRQVQEAVQINGATEIALTFADYLDPSWAGRTDNPFIEGSVGELIRRIQYATGVPVTMVGTGPHSVIERRVDARRAA